VRVRDDLARHRAATTGARGETHESWCDARAIDPSLARATRPRARDATGVER